jgi:hypothetical protein
VEDAPVDLQEAAPARHLEGLVVLEEVGTHRLVLGLGAEAADHVDRREHPRRARW